MAFLDDILSSETDFLALPPGSRTSAATVAEAGFRDDHGLGRIRISSVPEVTAVLIFIHLPQVWRWSPARKRTFAHNEGKSVKRRASIQTMECAP